MIAVDEKVGFCSATDFIKRLLKREITVSEYIESFINRYDECESQIHAWICFDREGMRKKAAALDESFEKHVPNIGGEYIYPLYGVPVAVKDIFNTFDMSTEHGSQIFKGYTPGNDARVVTDIRRSNGIIMGKTVTAELGVHTPGATKNPFDLSRTPGTSSSGSAAAIACGMAPIALASQTGGSTIRPSSYCGIIGFKPSFGVLPRTAMLKTTDTLDTVGIMARDISDIALLFDVLRVKGLNYPIVNEKLISYPKPAAKWRIGVLRGVLDKNHSPDVMSAFDKKIRQLSEDFDVVAIELPASFNHTYKLHTHIYHKALSYYFKREWGLYPDKFSEGMRAIMEEGFSISSESYQEACLHQTQLIHQFDSIFDGIDILVCPSAGSVAPVKTDENIKPDYNHLLTLCQVPTISLPLMEGDSGLPVGLQFIARKYHDYQLIEFCCNLLR